MRLSGAQRLILFASGLGAAGAILWLGPLRDPAPPTTLASLPWWVFLAACYVASLLYVEVRAHRESSTLSMAEIPVVIGLFLIDPRLLLGCYAGGLLLAHWTRRRVRPAKDFANIMLDILYIAVAVGIFDLVGPDRNDPLAARSLIALACAMAVAGWLLAPLALTVGSYLHQRPLPRSEVVRAFALRVVVTATNTCLGIVGLVFAVYRPLLAFAMVPPVVLMLVAAETRRRAARMEFLYRTSDMVHSATQMSEFAAGMLSGLSRMFGMARCELMLIAELRGAALHFVATGAESDVAVSSTELTFAEQAAINSLRHVGVLSGSAENIQTPVGALLAERGAGHGTVVALRGRERPQGLLLLLEPSNRGRRLTNPERNLLLTVSRQISASLEHGQLAVAIRSLTVEKAQLTRNAFFDPLTQIANSTLFTESVASALARLSTTRKPVATLIIDLDDFKQINDRYGHAAGDQVLNVVATRLRAQVRKVDMAARLGGDEFAILLDGMRSPNDVHVIARRALDLLRRPIPVGEHSVRVAGSVGVAVVDAGLDPPAAQELLRQADMAMYLAKRQGKDRYVVFDSGAREPVVATSDGKAFQPAVSG